MTETLAFRPPMRRGLLIHIVTSLVIGAASASAFFFGFNQQAGTAFVLLLLLSLLLFAPLPWMIYRAYALTRAAYRLERDGLRLRWGLRAEDIPLPDVEWVRRADDLAINVPLPPFSMPGAILGTVRAADLGTVEFMASTTHNLLLIATAQRVYAISPEDMEGFLRGFQRSLEMGSLTPFSYVSVLPAAYVMQIWSDRLARWLLLAGFALTLLLFAGVSLAIPTRISASLGFYPDGTPLPAGPAAQMMLLPILGAFAYVTDLATGVFFYRREPNRRIAYLVWAGSVVTAALLSAAVFFILAYSR